MKWKFGDKVWCKKWGNGVVGGNESERETMFVILPDGVTWDYINKLELRRGWKKRPRKRHSERNLK